MESVAVIENLLKAMEAGGYGAGPGALVQGSALQREDLSPVITKITFEDKHLKLGKSLPSETVKSQLSEFTRQLSYGIFGGSAQIEGAVGQEETSDFVRVTVPMCYYSHTRRITLASKMVETVDGKKSDARAAEDATKKVVGDIEFDLFRGREAFSNAGVYDGNPNATPNLASMPGIDLQVRQSDAQRQAHDLMFSEYGSDDTVVIQGGGILQQGTIEDAHVRSAMNLGSAEDLFIDPKVLSAYNKVALGKERIILAGSAQDSTGADLRKQWTSGGVVTLEASRFLSGKTNPQRARSNGPQIPSIPATATVAGTTSAFVVTSGSQIYTYQVTAVNEIGESPLSGPCTATITTTGQQASFVITGTGVVRYFNVYRSAANGSVVKFIGRVMNQGAAGTTFVDLNNKIPAFVTGYLLDRDGWDVAELCGYSRQKLAQADLTETEAHYRFLTLRGRNPRKSVLIDSLIGSF